MVQRQDIISMYEATGSIRAVAKELGMRNNNISEKIAGFKLWFDDEMR